jgi:cell division protein FtsN
VDLFTGQSVRHEITTAEGASVAAGGLVSEEDRVQLEKVPALKDSPILKYLFAKGVDNPAEIVVLVSPRVVRAPIVPAGIERISPAPALITQDRYTVQVGAFQSQANALTLLAELGKRYPDAFIQKVSADAAVYRVRVGRLSDLQDVQQLEKQLRSEGLHPLVLALK